MSKRALLGILATFGIAGVASAGTLVAGPVTTFQAGSSRCLASNVSSKTLATIALTLVNFQGTATSTKTCASVAPGAGCFLDGNGTDGGNTCRIDVSGSKYTVRGSLEVSQGPLGSALYASSAAR
jgi:hypothetical protein